MIVLLTLSIAALATGCIFNDGSADELNGVYGVEDFFYRDADKITHNYADQCDYYIMTFDDGVVKTYYKPVDGEEVVHEYSFRSVVDSDGKVEKVALADFYYRDYSGNGDKVTTTLTVQEESFDFYPMREELVLSSLTLRRNTADTSNVFVKDKLGFKKMYNRVTDKNVEKAKTKQTQNREARTATTEDSDDE